MLSFSDNQKEIYEYLLVIFCQCQNVHALTEAELAIHPSIFLQFLTNTLPGHGMTYRSYAQKSLFLNLDLEVISVANFDIDDKDRRKNEPNVNTNSYEEEAKNSDNNHDFAFIDLPRKFLRKNLKKIKEASFIADDEEVLHEALEILNELLFKKSIPTESNIPLEQQEVRCHEHEPKLKRPRDLTLRKKKDKFNAKHGETSERFKVARAIKTTASRDTLVEKVQEMGEM